MNHGLLSATLRASWESLALCKKCREFCILHSKSFFFVVAFEFIHPARKAKSSRCMTRCHSDVIQSFSDDFQRFIVSRQLQVLSSPSAWSLEATKSTWGAFSLFDFESSSGSSSCFPFMWFALYVSLGVAFYGYCATILFPMTPHDGEQKSLMFYTASSSFIIHSVTTGEPMTV